MDSQSSIPGGSGRWGFVGRPIRVVTDDDLRQPVSFEIDGTERRIAEVLVSWFDWGFPAGAKQRDWKTRRHRKYFRILTEAGEIFEIYQDRRGADRPGDWICYQQWIAQTED